ncbi:outer membrane protein OmpW, partial [Salmonella enterica subsp. enterica serovar Mbandaka]|nr:outer membrane protein OmpW [Salmonella enterica subsp. enterica serovar Mbandaka]
MICVRSLITSLWVYSSRFYNHNDGAGMKK